MACKFVLAVTSTFPLSVISPSVQIEPIVFILPLNNVTSPPAAPMAYSLPSMSNVPFRLILPKQILPPICEWSKPNANIAFPFDLRVTFPVMSIAPPIALIASY